MSVVRFIDVGHYHPAMLSTSLDFRNQTGLKQCCLRKQCIPSTPSPLRKQCSPCGLLDLFYDRKRASEGPKEEHEGARQYRLQQDAKVERKRQKVASQEAQTSSAISHVAAQREQQAAESTDGVRCTLFLQGRCARIHSNARMHGDPDTVHQRAQLITCRSCRVEGQPFHDSRNPACPFKVPLVGRRNIETLDRTCHFGGHGGGFSANPSPRWGQPGWGG